ncbi:MAG: hypothetical protein ACLQFR_26220 [Streptosporangiaceae bacterium]
MSAVEVIAAFAAAWNAQADAERLLLLADSCLPDAVFVAPQGTTAGTAGLSTSIGEFRRAFPVAVVKFDLPDEHSGFVRVAWIAHFNNGRPALTGEDFAQLAADGRIRLLVSLDGASSAGQ